jgi:transposase-like protein
VTFEEILPRLARALDAAQVPYMLTGSVASSAHGFPRSTQDIDIVIAPTRAGLLALIRQFPEGSYYADQQQALNALDRKSQFNVIDFATGWKIDFIIAQDSSYGREAFGRRAISEIDGVSVYVVTPEDAIISKLQWAKASDSERQLRDVAGILAAQGDKLEIPYIERWTRELGVEDLWQMLKTQP